MTTFPSKECCPKCWVTGFSDYDDGEVITPLKEPFCGHEGCPCHTKNDCGHTDEQHLEVGCGGHTKSPEEKCPKCGHSIPAIYCKCGSLCECHKTETQTPKRKCGCGEPNKLHVIHREGAPCYYESSVGIPIALPTQTPPQSEGESAAVIDKEPTLPSPTGISPIIPEKGGQRSAANGGRVQPLDEVSGRPLPTPPSTGDKIEDEIVERFCEGTFEPPHIRIRLRVALKEYRESIEKDVGAASLQLVETLHAYNTDGIKALAEARKEGRTQAIQEMETLIFKIEEGQLDLEGVLSLLKGVKV